MITPVKILPSESLPHHNEQLHKTSAVDGSAMPKDDNNNNNNDITQDDNRKTKSMEEMKTQQQKQQQQENGTNSNSTICTIRNKNYNLVPCNLPPKSELEPVEKFVESAILSQLNMGGAADPAKQGYYAIISAIRNPDDPAMVKMVFIALKTAEGGRTLYRIAASSTTYAQLVHLLIKFNPFDVPKSLRDKPDEIKQPFLDFSLADAHLNLLVALISAKSVFANQVISAMWRLLARYRSEPDEARIHRIHSLLATVVRLCPKSRMEFFPILSTYAPYRTRPCEVMIWFYSQCLRVLDYLPSIRTQVLESIIGMCLDIDVDIKIKEDGDAMIDQEGNNYNNGGTDDGIFELELEQDNVTNTPSKSKVDKSGLDVGELSEKLDSLLLLLFQYIRDAAKSVSGVRELYLEVLPFFESSILTSHKSKFVQFYVFLLCGLEIDLLKATSTNTTTSAAAVASCSNHTTNSTDEQENSDGDNNNNNTDFLLLAALPRDFVSRLINVAVDPYRAIVTRQSSACYIASFLSRSSFVCPETICESLSALLRWAESYIESMKKTNYIRAPATRDQAFLHSSFYNVCQALFYIMCYRGSEAVQYYKFVLAHYDNNSNGNATLSSLSLSSSSYPGMDGTHTIPALALVDIGSARWTTICRHELQPLRFCLESVRTEFLHVANTFGLLSEHDIEALVSEARVLSTGRVKRKQAAKISTAAILQKKRETPGVGGLGKGSNPLKTFFPFDPFLLRQSHDFVDPYYIHWQGPLEDDDMPDWDEDEANNDDDDESDTDDVVVVIDDDDNKSTGSMDDDGYYDHGEHDDYNINDDDDVTASQSEAQPMSLASNAGGDNFGMSMGDTSRLGSTNNDDSEGHPCLESFMTTREKDDIDNGSW